MLVENAEAIEFAPGSQVNGRKVLGRIVVHDRLQVEATVLPRYFNHSSFASLRRQLNYFAFQRLGKGRQRESSYTNEHVVELDDILHLKRRPNTGKSRAAKKSAAGAAAAAKERQRGVGLTTDEDEHDDNATAQSNTLVSVSSSSTAPPVLNVSEPAASRPLQQRSNKRGRHQAPMATMTTISPRSLSPMENSFISEDEHYFYAAAAESKQRIALDLTQPDLSAADKDVLEGCKDLLQLMTSKGWD